MAYADTVGDLVMGWFGTIAAALLVHLAWRSHMPTRRPNELDVSLRLSRRSAHAELRPAPPPRRPPPRGRPGE